MTMPEDAPKMVLVWRHDLKVRKGKFAAQIAHAAMAVLTEKIRVHPGDVIDDPESVPVLLALTEVERLWLTGIFTKIVLRVESEDELLAIYEAAIDAGLQCHLIQDAGLTEIPPGTYTCCSIGPDYGSRIDPITGHLSTL